MMMRTGDVAIAENSQKRWATMYESPLTKKHRFNYLQAYQLKTKIY